MKHKTSDEQNLYVLGAAYLASQKQLQKDIADNLDISQPEVSRLLKRAEKNGWLEPAAPKFACSEPELIAQMKAKFFSSAKVLQELRKLEKRSAGDARRLTAQVLRAFPKHMVYAQITAGFEMCKADKRVVALNLVQPEDWLIPMHDYDLHMRMIDVLHGISPNVNITLHAGEITFGQVPPEELGRHIKKAMELQKGNQK